MVGWYSKFFWSDVEGTTESRLDDVEVFLVRQLGTEEDQVMKRPGVWEGTHFRWGTF